MSKEVRVFTLLRSLVNDGKMTWEEAYLIIVCIDTMRNNHSLELSTKVGSVGVEALQALFTTKEA